MFESSPLLFPADAPQSVPPQKLVFDPKDTPFKTPLPEKLTAFPIHSTLDVDYNFTYYKCPNLDHIGLEIEKKWDLYLQRSKIYHDYIKQAMKIFSIPDKWMEGKPLLEKCFQLGDLVMMDNFNNPKPTVDKGSSLYT